MCGSPADIPVASGSRWPSTRSTALLVALALPLFFVKLGDAGLVDPDEPYYALPALEMLRSGKWSVPLFHGQPWFDKPVLFYWVILAAFKTFGVSEWAARLGSALAGSGGVIALALASPSRWRRGGAHVLAAIVLATSLEYALLARAAVTDMTLTFFLTLGFLAFARHLESQRLTDATWAGAAFGLAALTKGPVGLIVPVVALAGYGLATRRRAMLASRAGLCLLTGVLATAAPWYVYMLAEHRELVVTVFLGQGNLGRFLNPEHQQVPLFYVWVLAAGLLPWSGALPGALARACGDIPRRVEGPGASPGTVYALTWFLAVIAVFSLSASKLASYVLPAFPAAAFLIADYWCATFTSRVGAKGPRAAAWVGAAISIAAGAALLAIPEGARYRPTRPEVFALAALLGVAAIAAVVAVRRGHAIAFVAVQAATTTVILLFVVLLAWPRLDATASTKTLVRRLETHGLAAQLAGAYRVRDVSLDYYLGRPLPRESDPQRLRRQVDGDAPRLWIVPAGDVEAIADEGLVAIEPVLTVARRAVVRLSPAPRASRGSP